MKVIKTQTECNITTQFKQPDREYKPKPPEKEVEVPFGEFLDVAISKLNNNKQNGVAE